MIKLGVFYLICKHEDCFHGEAAATEVEEVFQTGS